MISRLQYQWKLPFKLLKTLLLCWIELTENQNEIKLNQFSYLACIRNKYSQSSVRRSWKCLPIEISACALRGERDIWSVFWRFSVVLCCVLCVVWWAFCVREKKRRLEGGRFILNSVHHNKMRWRWWRWDVAIMAMLVFLMYSSGFYIPNLKRARRHHVLKLQMNLR